MVPDKFDMVDMEGIDLLEVQGVPVDGLYDKLVESITLCRYQCLYNWKFNGILIPPTYVEMEVGENEEVVVNFGMSVTTDDVIHLQTIEPEPPEPVIIPLLAEENMVYEVPSGVDGFNPVTVDVPSYTPEIESITITENGTYTAPSGVDGYSPVIVDIESESSFIVPDYGGLSWAYVAQNGDFYQANDGKQYYLNCFHVKQNETYSLFIGATTSDRNRCAFYSGKTINDFTQYINNGGTATSIYTATVPISYSAVSGEPAANIRYIFTAPSDGEVILCSSRSSVSAVGYCVKL